MHGDFKLADAGLNLSNLRYDIPGATIKLAGIYSLMVLNSTSPELPICKPLCPEWSEVGEACC